MEEPIELLKNVVCKLRNPFCMPYTIIEEFKNPKTIKILTTCCETLSYSFFDEYSLLALAIFEAFYLKKTKIIFLPRLINDLFLPWFDLILKRKIEDTTHQSYYICLLSIALCRNQVEIADLIFRKKLNSSCCFDTQHLQVLFPFDAFNYFIRTNEIQITKTGLQKLTALALMSSDIYYINCLYYKHKIAYSILVKNTSHECLNWIMKHNDSNLRTLVDANFFLTKNRANYSFLVINKLIAPTYEQYIYCMKFKLTSIVEQIKTYYIGNEKIFNEMHERYINNMILITA